MLVGEQPGDVEDREGVPFVGPAGKVLQDALGQAGLDVGQVYVTNAVKHFRFTERGKRRIHATPLVSHIKACRPWLEAELRLVDPKLIVCLGATAAKALLGNDFRVTKQRGQVLDHDTPIGMRRVLATVHPSSILRGDPAERESALAAFVADLRTAGAAGWLEFPARGDIPGPEPNQLRVCFVMTVGTPISSPRPDGDGDDRNLETPRSQSMFDQIGNMPLHPLVLHAAVVGIPLAVLLAFLFVLPQDPGMGAVGVRADRRSGRPQPPSSPRQSGEALQRMLNLQPGTSAAADLIQKHSQLADQLFIIMIIFSVVGVANVLLVSRGSSAAGTTPSAGAATARRDLARAAGGDRRDRDDLGDPGRRSGIAGGLESERGRALHHASRADRPIELSFAHT